VRLENGQVRSGTRQQLEEALAAGHLGADAFVLAAGTSEWMRLGDLMGAPPAAPMAAPVAAPEQGPVAAAEPPPLEAPEAAPTMAAEAPPVAAEPVPAAASEETPEQAPSAEAAAAEQPSPETAAPEQPSPETAADEQPGPMAAAADANELWQVKLTLRQLEEAFHAGLLDDDTQVLAAGADEWVQLGDIRRAQPAPFGNALSMPAGDQGGALHQESASRTEPWPATTTANGHSSAGE
jgi:hypothetical protein